VKITDKLRLLNVNPETLEGWSPGILLRILLNSEELSDLEVEVLRLHAPKKDNPDFLPKRVMMNSQQLQTAKGLYEKGLLSKTTRMTYILSIMGSWVLSVMPENSLPD
jgi:hypothetical protein